MLSAPEHDHKEGGHSPCSTPPGEGEGGLPAAVGLSADLECFCVAVPKPAMIRRH